MERGLQFNNACVDNSGRVFTEAMEEVPFLGSRIDCGIARDMHEELTATRQLRKGQAEYLTGTYCYGGILYPHYGHFLLESLSRLYAYQQGQGLLTWSSVQTGLKKYQDEILSLLLPGPRNIKIISNVAFCECLIVHKRGYVITDSFSQEHCHFLAEAGKKIYRRDSSVGRVWLSRRGYRSIEGEMLLEERLAKGGWKIVEVQKMSISEQLNIFMNATAVAGVKGSCFHTAILSPIANIPKVMLERFHREDAGVMDNYELIDQARGETSKLITGNLDVRCDEEACALASIIEDILDRKDESVLAV